MEINEIKMKFTLNIIKYGVALAIIVAVVLWAIGITYTKVKTNQQKIDYNIHFQYECGNGINGAGVVSYKCDTLPSRDEMVKVVWDRFPDTKNCKVVIRNVVLDIDQIK